jgi:hypothetical protein
LVTGDSSEQVGLNIPLRFIFKPSYSPHCINTNVVHKAADEQASWTATVSNYYPLLLDTAVDKGK